MKKKKRVVVLIHGRHLAANGWEVIVWGNPKKEIYGQASRGVKLALEIQDDVYLYWGSGASEKNGLKESECALNHTLAHWSEIPNLKDRKFRDIKQWFVDRSILDTTSQNTEQEIQGALSKCRELGANRLYLVSSPTHISRCMLLAQQSREKGLAVGIDIYAVASDIPYTGYSAEDVVVVEPPQRGDMPKWQTFRYVRAILSLMRSDEKKFNKFLLESGELLAKYGIKVVWTPLDSKSKIKR